MSLVIVEAVVKVGSHLVEDLVASGVLRGLTLANVVDRFHHYHFRGHPDQLAQVRSAIAKAEAPPAVEATVAESAPTDSPAPSIDVTPPAIEQGGGSGADPGSPDPGTPPAAPVEEPADVTPPATEAAAPVPIAAAAPPKSPLGPPPGAKNK
jgi:hypothetical protein